MVQTTSVAPGRTAQIAPRVDHHQHLLSPAGAARANRLLPAIELPADVAQLLAARAAHWSDPAALSPLYTEDAIVRTTDNVGWITGRSAVAKYLGTRFAAPFRLTPVSFRHTAATAEVAGYLTRGEGPSAKPFAYFLLALERGEDRRWRIAAETPMLPGPVVEEPETAAQLISFVDEAGIQRAVVLSDAYMFDSPKIGLAEADAKLRAVQAENDWTADQVQRFPQRLVAFCSFSPLEDYALAELDRCAASGRFKGLKMHFGVSHVDLKNPEHVAKVRRIMEAANRLRLPVIIHVRADATYGREHAQIFLHRVVAAAPDVPVTIAHLWGGELFSEEALAVYADAVAAGDPPTRNLYFDIAEVALAISNTPAAAPKVVSRMRQIGLERILYGSDGPVAESATPLESWKRTLTLPLTQDEFRTIANNVAPYLR
jgi:predicted TIM-barrel fold metal-dependent hydrolase